MKASIRFVAAAALALACPSCGDTARKEANTKEAASAPVAEATVYAGKLALFPPELYKKVKAGTKEAEFAFSARNDGDVPIRISRVDPGCACIAASVSKDRLQPGETAQISALYDTTNVNGLAEKALGVLTDQPGVHEAFLIVRLETEPIYRFNASQIFPKGQPETRAVSFEVLRDDPLKILSVVPSRSEIKAELKTITPGRKYEILVTPDTSAQLLGLVRIQTDCEVEAHARPLIYVIVQ